MVAVSAGRDMTAVLAVLVQSAVLIALLCGPIIVFLLIRDRFAATAGRLACALGLAVLAGLGAWVAARTVGLALQTRLARVDVPPALAAPLFFGFTGVMLTILTLRPAARPAAHGGPPRAQAAAVPPPAHVPAHHAADLRLKRVFWLMIGIHATALLAWPLLSYGAVFAFDDPNGNRLLAWFIALSIWLYPGYVAAGFVWGHYSRHTQVYQVVLRTSVPLLSAVWFFLIPLVASLGLGWLREPSLEQVVQRRDELRARLDPIYEQRTATIRARDALEDAREAIRRGDVALLPHEPGTDHYFGLDGVQPSRAPVANDSILRGSEYLRALVGLLSDDPSHPTRRTGDVVRSDYVSYWTPVYQDYLAARRAYMTQFNTHVYQHLEARQR